MYLMETAATTLRISLFIHGIGQTGTNWLTKPDGNPGWSSYFLRQGYTIYILDQPSHGRSPFLGPPINNYTHVFPLSAEPGGPGSGVQGHPAFDAYFAATVPSLVANIPQQTAVRNAGAALLDHIGAPVILIGHSQGGTMPWLIADVRPGHVHAIVALEPAGPPFVEPALNGNVPARAWGMTDIPMTYEPPVVDPAEDLVLTVTRANSTDEEDCWVQAESPVPRHLVNLKGVRALVVTGKTIPEPRQRTIRLGRTTEPGARPRSVGAEWLPRPAVLRAGDLAGLVGSKDLRSQDPTTPQDPT
ncbi:hypothetical protein V496_05832 [Pseudogymnoascus sp. VKM F-4515 (FW-2607)]|nr:hypothetical protein V496_05832 [Pseudogymnoascus sp. VKM F-4515 (FW-2607)]KFY96833.1 hypothetical protein V498_02426 [Pseudogymnoascus sp. VKM F-4517 (FW-2822)]